MATKNKDDLTLWKEKITRDINMVIKSETNFLYLRWRRSTTGFADRYVTTVLSAGVYLNLQGVVGVEVVVVVRCLLVLRLFVVVVFGLHITPAEVQYPRHRRNELPHPLE